MTDLIKFSKKIFTVGVVATTIFWSVGVAALVPGVANAAECPTLAPGDMIKVSGKPTIYVVNNDLKVLYFPTGDDFKSWRPTYGGYTTITQACYDSLSVPATYPGAVNYRPGSFIVKRPSSDQLYAVLPGNSLSKITLEAAKALYGNDFNVKVGTNATTKEAMYKNMMVVNDRDWPHYVNRGTDITEAIAHPGMLVKVGTVTYYVNADKTLSEVTETGITANAFLTKFVRTLTAANIAGLTVGTKIDAEVKAITDKSQSGGVASTPTTTGAVTVSLSASTPAAGNVVVNIDNVAFTKVNLTAGSSAAVVSSLTIGRMGLGSTNDFDSVTVYDGATKLGSTRTSWDSNNQIVYNIPSGLSIAAGSSKELTIVGKLGSGKTGTYNALGIVAVNGSAVPAVYGNQLTGVAVTVGGVTITNVGSNSTKNIGSTDVTLANFKLAINSVEKGSFQRITLKNKGTAADGDVANVSLWFGTKKLAGPVSMVSDKVTFSLSEPVLIDKSKNEEFKVIGDVVAGSANTVNFILENTTDLYVIGQTYNTSLTVTSGAYDTASTDGTTITISGAELNIAYSGTAVDTQADKTDISFGTLTLSAGGTDVKVTSLVLTIDETASTTGGVIIADVDNFEMIEANGGAYSGTMTNGGDTDADDETWTFDDEIYLTKGQTRTFTLRGDIPAGVTSGDSYKVTMVVNTSNLVAETVPDGDAVSNFSVGSINGKYVTVKTPYLTFRPVGMNNTNAVVNQKDVVIFKTTAEATAGAVTISRLRFEGGNTAASNVTYTAANLDKTNFADLGLYVQNADGTYQPALQTITSGNMTDGEADFNSFSYTIQPGTANKVTFVLKATISATLDGSNTSVHAQLDTITAKDADNNAAAVKDAAGTAIATAAELETTGTITLGGTGTLYVSMRNADTDFNKDRVALAGSSYWVGKLRLRADYEAVKIKDLKLTNNSADDEDSVDSVCLYKSQTTAADQLIACGTLGTDDVVFFDDMNYVVNQGTQDVYVRVTLRPMSNLANGTSDTNDLIELSITTSSANNLLVTGESSGTDLAFGNNNGTVASGEIVFDLDLDGNFDESVADIGGTAQTKQFVVQGSRPSNIAMLSTYGGYTVDTSINGTGTTTLAIFSITNETNANTNSSGDALNLIVGKLNLNLTKHSTTTFSDATIQRINGAVAAVKLDAFDVTSTAVGQTSDTWTLLTASSTTKLGEDSKIAAGQTAYFVVKATISGLDSTATTQVIDWAKLSLNSLGTSDSATNNIQWYDGYSPTTASTLIRYLRLDTTSIDGTKISE